jgi:peptidoglycan hydrolase CwlO-like protein
MTTVEIFKKMLNWLYANKKAGNQTDVARKAGLNEVTVSRILNGRVKKAKQETLWAVNTAYGNVFNPDWLRGDSDVMLMADLTPVTEQDDTAMHNYAQQTTPPDMSSMINAIIAANDQTIMSLRRELAGKDETIAGRDALVSTLQQQVSDLRQQNDDLRQQIADLRKALAAAQSKDVLKEYPFSLGTAEDDQRPRATK